jgi:NitT/TauT family transport system substrate-binding protein
VLDASVVDTDVPVRDLHPGATPAPADRRDAPVRGDAHRRRASGTAEGPARDLLPIFRDNDAARHGRHASAGAQARGVPAMFDRPNPARVILGLALGAALAVGATAAAAQPTQVRFQLDWRFEGPAALFTLPAKKGYFRDEKLEVTIDAGNGSGGTVTRVAAGTYDMGFADLAALMEFWGNNPGAPSKPVAVMMVYNNTPAAVLALRKSGIRTPADLDGKRLGAPVFDAGRKAFPIFAKANKLDPGRIAWTSMDPPLRETMLVRGDVDAITGFYFTSLLNLNARGVKDEDIVILPYPQFGVKLYGNVIIASESFLKRHPEAVRAFLRAFTRGVKDVVADPAAAIASVRDRDGLIDVALETRRLKLALAGSVVTADAKAEGFGEVSAPRLALMASQVNDAFGLKERIQPDRIFVTDLLPPKEQRNVFTR